jgi:hypothetical protein
VRFNLRYIARADKRLRQDCWTNEAGTRQKVVQFPTVTCSWWRWWTVFHKNNSLINQLVNEFHLWSPKLHLPCSEKSSMAPVPSQFSPVHILMLSFVMLVRLVLRSCGIAQAGSRWLPTAVARVRSHFRSCRICGGQSDTGRIYPTNSHSASCSKFTDHHYHRHYEVSLLKA